LLQRLRLVLRRRHSQKASAFDDLKRAIELRGAVRRFGSFFEWRDGGQKATAQLRRKPEKSCARI
jgi:hypothetical protein